MPRIGGRKYCGTRGGESFLNTVRPVRSTSTSDYKCPVGYKSCSGSEALTDELAENVVCLEDTSNCPITEISYEQNTDGNFEFTVSKDSSKSLPLSTFKFSTDTPCINSEEEPSGTEGYFKDEYTSAQNGCQKNEFYDTAINSNYKYVPNFKINQGKLELENGIANIF